MKLSLEQIKSVTQGAVNVTEEEDGFHFYRFSAKEEKTTENANVNCPAGVQLEFITDASGLWLKGNIHEAYEIRSYYAIDVFADEIAAGCISNCEEGACTGNYAEKKYPMGSFAQEITWEQKHEKEDATGRKIRMVLPHSVVLTISEMTLVGASYLIPVKKTKRMIAYGDSITQGYDALHPSDTYAMSLADVLDAELVNKGLGGAQFLPELAAAAEPGWADYITIAYGTNDWNASTPAVFRKKASDFLDVICEKYPEVPTFVVTPVWRRDHRQIKEFGPFSEVERILEEVCREYPQVKMISGWDLIPHEETCFGDLRLHPNGNGFKHYSKNLRKQLL